MQGILKDCRYFFAPIVIVSTAFSGRRQQLWKKFFSPFQSYIHLILFMLHLLHKTVCKWLSFGEGAG